VRFAHRAFRPISLTRNGNPRRSAAALWPLLSARLAVPPVLSHVVSKVAAFIHSVASRCAVLLKWIGISMPFSGDDLWGVNGGPLVVVLWWASKVGASPREAASLVWLEDPQRLLVPCK
jgi:hypothetical protein